MNKDKLKMNLQMFGGEGDEGGEGAGAGGNPDEGGSGEGTEPDVKLPKSEEELQNLIDNAVKTRLARQKEKTEAEIKKVKEKAKADAKRYADMSESEKAQAELDEKIKEIEEREKELNNRELLGNIKTDLTAKGLPDVFADSLLVIQDNEKIKTAINEIKTAWDEEIAEAIKASVRQETPNTSSRSYAGKDKGIKSKADFFNAGRKVD